MLQTVVEEGGFARDNIMVVNKVLVVIDDENIMSGSMMSRAREGYTDEEEARWVESVSQRISSWLLSRVAFVSHTTLFTS